LIREWIEGVLIRGKPHGLIQFNTTVELAEYDQKSAEWKLTLRKEQPGQETDYWWQEKFDTLVVASGHFYRPYIPDIPGLLEFDETFPGRLQHSKHYRNVEEYRDKVRKSRPYFRDLTIDKTLPESCGGRGLDIRL
jgi:cation diffusion facilitator CzcD-associated flavoprotein CzcO